MDAEFESQRLWYLDSGCRNQMTKNHEIFVDPDKNYSSQVKLGDGKPPLLPIGMKGNKNLISNVFKLKNKK